VSAYPYATLANVKARMSLTSTGNDPVLSRLCDMANALVEGVTHRSIGSNTGTYTFDGSNAREEMRCLPLNNGIQSISLLEIAPYTGAAYVTVPASDYFIRPSQANREPGWPGTEVWMTNIPSTTNTYPYFPVGYDTVRVTGVWGWSDMPLEVRDVAERTVIRAFQSRQAGEADGTGSADIGEQLIRSALTAADRRTLMRFAWRSVDII